MYVCVYIYIKNLPFKIKTFEHLCIFETIYNLDIYIYIKSKEIFATEFMNFEKLMVDEFGTTIKFVYLGK